MLRDVPLWVRYAARYAALYGAFVSFFVYWTWGLGFGAPLETALAGAALPSALGGLYFGARLPIEAGGWKARRLPLRPLLKWPDPRIAGMRMAAGVWLAVFLTWAAVAGKPIIQVFAAHGVLAGVFLGSMGVGAVWSVWTGSARMSVFLGALTWAVVWSAFIWMPAAFPPQMTLMNAAVNMNPLIGIMTALNQRGLFWNPLFYGWLPYADYALTLRGAAFHFALWTGVGVLGVGVACLRLRFPLTRE